MKRQIPTKEQRCALWRVFCRSYDGTYENNRTLLKRYRQFRREAFFAFGNCLMIRWAGMLIGIETDGHTHT